MSNKKDPFASISSADLNKVSGGATRVTSRNSAANDQITQMLSTVTDSINQLANNKPAMDPMMMMMMMMMMGGGGGGASAAPVAAAPPPMPAQPPVINISTSVKRGGW